MLIEAIGLGLTFLTAVVVAVWTLSNKISDVKEELSKDVGEVKVGLATVSAQVTLMMTNHLVHLPGEVAKAVRGDTE